MIWEFFYQNSDDVPRTVTLHYNGQTMVIRASVLGALAKQAQAQYDQYVMLTLESLENVESMIRTDDRGTMITGETCSACKWWSRNLHPETAQKMYHKCMNPYENNPDFGCSVLATHRCEHWEKHEPEENQETK
jgi:hypothetical protein